MDSQRHEFDDPAAQVVWAAVCSLEEGLQHELLGRLRDRLAIADRETAQGVRVARAIGALRECAILLGHPPSVGEYRREQVDHPEWPPDGSLRSWLGGSWIKCLERARLDADLVGEDVGVDHGPEFTVGEVKRALLDAAEELSREEGAQVIPAFHRYLAWAKRPDVRRRPGRRPRSQSVFERLFGSYLQALVVAGLISGVGDQAAPRVSANRTVSGYRYTDSQVLAGLHRVVLKFNGRRRLRKSDRFPSGGEYSRTRTLILEELEAAGRPPVALPSYQLLWRKWGSWSEIEARYRKERGAK